MNETSSSLCAISVYLNLCAFSKVLLLLPGFGLNIFILVSLVFCLLSRQNKIRSNVAMFILGSTSSSIINLSLWPMTIHWRLHDRWLLGSHLCEVVVRAKHLTRAAYFHYVSFIIFSIYLTVVCGCRHLVNSRLFLTLQLFLPLLLVGLMELTLWLLGSSVNHLDPVHFTCFSYINDKALRIVFLGRAVLFFPMSLYFCAHILHTIVTSARLMHRSQRNNVHLAKVFGLISLTTFVAHIPGAVFALMEQPSICHETVTDLLLDLPLLSSPIILLCMNKELRNQCLFLLQRKHSNRYMEKVSKRETIHL
ncbi:hypothetical protein Q5P01_009150 [Channa striata]|uniref:Uncharacterized protein n=1 Tax=Channa striata TaxID=64152 RepID=A0AA88SSB2_CHASR|nr:hypothetical protein Q5P01_009150 [Channa striata]